LWGRIEIILGYNPLLNPPIPHRKGKANGMGFGQLAKVVLAAEVVVKKGVLLGPNRLRLESH
jgi:hypothetical protein